ncbi:hypothetical protein [Serratia marcescens]
MAYYFIAETNVAYLNRKIHQPLADLRAEKG